MTTTTRNRLLTLILILLITLLAGELSYYAFNHRTQPNPTPTPSPSPNSTPTTSTTNIPQSSTNSNADIIQKRFQALSPLTDPANIPYLSQLKISYSFTGQVVKVTPNKITLKTSTTSEPLELVFVPPTLKKLQIILGPGKTGNQLTDIPLKSTVIITITKNILQPISPFSLEFPATTLATITVTSNQ